jgi:hypothetical protein
LNEGKGRGHRGSLVSCCGGDRGRMAQRPEVAALLVLVSVRAAVPRKKTAKTFYTLCVFTKRKRILMLIRFREEKDEYYGTVFVKRRRKLIWCASRAGQLGRMG